MLALQATALPSIAAATTEIMPSVASVFSQSRRAFGSRAQSGGARAFTQASLNNRTSAFPPIAIRDAFAAARKGTFAAAHPVSSRPPVPTLGRRYISKLSAFQSIKPRIPFTKVASEQNRNAWTSSMSQNNLARMEAAANQNPHSAVAQNAFYQALLKANMPQIVSERYQSGHFASNAQCEAAYHQALGALGAANGHQTFDASLGNSPGLSPQYQAIGQAVAAQTKGGNVGISRGQNPASSGERNSPLYVVVEETIGGVIFKWIKLFLYFALTCYICMGLFSLAVETLGSFKRAGAKNGGSEVKAAQQKVRFSDVHGCDEAKEELQEVVDFLKNPEKFSTLGGKLPKGVLLVGPPGTGKTLLARAVAGEAGVPFFYMSGSEFDEVFVGVGAKRVRDLFSGAKGKSPAIIFIDELDAIGQKRSSRDHNSAKQTLNQLLTELDGFEQNSGVIVLAATNFPELLDKALTRPGRFDRNVVVGLPDVRGRMAIIKHHMKNIKPGDDVDIAQLANGTPGFSGAELENVVNQAAVHASKAKAKAVKMQDFEWAKDKVMMGAEKRSMLITDKEKEMTAYHEAGHALAVMYTEGANKLHKITIMPRGRSLGMTMHLPEMDSYSQSMKQYRAHIDVCMGGKVAEELIYGRDEVTSGCASDLQQATQFAYAMVTQFGMSDKLGNVDLRSNFRELSSETKTLIESEVKRTIEEARLRVVDLLTEKRNELDLLAKALVDYESLNKEEAYKVVKGEKLEGKMIMPSGPTKRPEGPTKPGMEVPAIPGSPEAAKENAPKDPPTGGLVQG